jgi:K+-sensing histidine kinase KdpD
MKNTAVRVGLLLAGAGLIGALDYFTGDELDLFVLYFIPVCWAAWTIGRRTAIAMAVLSAIIWFSANVLLAQAYSKLPLNEAWGEVAMLITFIGAALGTSRIRSLLIRERALNAELAEALRKVKRLSGRLPICLSCKNVQDADGDWLEIEEYFTHQSEDDFVFNQTICPHCRISHPEGQHTQTPGPALSTR